MVIIPVRTDLKLRHTPWVNGALIAINVIVFLLQIQGQVTAEQGAPWFVGYMLNIRDLHWYQFLSYQFLHGGWEHLIFNMVFLFVFGGPTEDRFGPLGYLFFYLAGGIVAGLGHIAASTGGAAPIWGASGSVSAVAGAFLVLFPFSRVTLSFYFIESFDVSGIVLVLFNFARDLIFQIFGFGGVAYMAHLSGNAFGFIVAMTLLCLGVLPRERFDMLRMWDRFKHGESIRPDDDTDDHADQPPEQLTEHQQQRVDEQRQIVIRTVSEVDDLNSLREYEKLMRMTRQPDLPRQVLLDTANHAMNHSRYDTAAHAYRQFLRDFADDGFTDQVHLMLGLLYARQLHDEDAARKHLHLASEKLNDPQRRAQAEAALEQLNT